MRRTAAISWIVLAGALAGATPAHAQSIGVGGGLAGIENFDPVTATVAAHVQVPMAGRFSLVGAYAHWFGNDGNRGLTDGAYYGDDGLSLVVLYDLAGSPAWDWSIGAGLGQYETEVVRFGDEDSGFIGGVTIATLLNIPVQDRLDVFVRGELAAPTTEFQPRWSYLVAGVALEF